MSRTGGKQKQRSAAAPPAHHHHQQQPGSYGFIEQDENPFDDVVTSPTRQARAQQPPPPQAQQQRLPAAIASGQRSAQYQAAPQTSPPPPQSTSPVPPPTAPTAAPPGPRKSALSSITSQFFGGHDSQPSSAYGHGGAMTAEEELALREANLRAREDKMRAKEIEVEERERQVRLAAGAANNWPFKFYPILYHSIQDDIPVRLQPMMKKFYALLLFTWPCLVWNFITCLTVWGETGDGGTDPVWSGVWMVMGIPGSWVFWYKPLYDAAKNNSSRRYLVFFIGFLIHIAFCIVIGLGTPDMGSGGLLVMIKEYAKSFPVSGTFALVDTCMYGVNILMSLYLLKVARDAWRSGGGKESLERDKAAMRMAARGAAVAV